MAVSSFFTLEGAGAGTKLFSFSRMEGPLVPARPTFDRVVRPGINNVGIWNTGTRGTPFAVTTTNDFSSDANALTEFASYKSKVSAKLDLYSLGALFATVLVHDVVLVRRIAVAASAGGNNISAGGSGVVLIAQWTVEALA